MSLAVGARLGPYEIVTFIGAGGMGEVYKARDTRLNRTVAIKVLPARYRGDHDRRRRLEREAQLIATLAHPHICTLYDVGQYEGGDFLVMEYLEGETLASRLLRGRLAVDQLLRHGAEIADALAQAHGQGITHRDLKPGNIMLTKGGVKLLDFGLARLRPTESASAPETTTAAQGTSTPEILSGTLPYMAPEQIEGATADARTDIFAFGAVLYEMASGRRAFRGDSPSDLINAILHRHPEPLGSIQPMAAGGLDRLIGKCLAKDPDARWQSASDLADELRWIAGGGGADATGHDPSRQRLMTRWVAIGIAVLLIAAGVAMWQWRGSLRAGPSDVQHLQVTSTGDVVMSALSPDGRTVAYVAGVPGGENRVLVRDVDGGESSIWTGRDILALAWQPDGSHVVVMGNREKRGVWVVPIVGGAARQLINYGSSVASSPDGAALAVSSQGQVGFDVVSLRSGETRVVSMSGFRRVLTIDWHSRSNRVVLLTTDDDELFSVWSVAPDGGDPSLLHTGNELIRAMCTSPVSDVVYTMVQRLGSMDLLRIPMSPDPGAKRVLLRGLTITAMGYRCTVSADGSRLLYGRRDARSNLWRLNLASSNTPPTPLTSGTQDLWHPAVSPDGRWIAATLGSEFAARLVKIPIRGGEPADLGEGAGPAWSPDGQRLAFTSRRSGSLRVWICGADGQRPQEVKDSAVGGPRPIWLPDNRLAWQTPDRRNYRIRDLVTGRDEHVFAQSPLGSVVSDARFSPRGDQLVVWRSQFERNSLLLSWPNPTKRFTIPGVRPIAWSADGEWIYAIALGGRSFARVSSRTGEIETIGQFPDDRQVTYCDLTPDAAAIICSLTQEKSDAWMMFNFDPDFA